MGLIHSEMAAVQGTDGFTYSIMSPSPIHKHRLESLNLLWDIRVCSSTSDSSQHRKYSE